MWNIKAVYPSGGHTVTVEGQTHFTNQQEALSLAESLNAQEKRTYLNIPSLNSYQPTVYIVVEAQ